MLDMRTIKLKVKLYFIGVMMEGMRAGKRGTIQWEILFLRQYFSLAISSRCSNYFDRLGNAGYRFFLNSTCIHSSWLEMIVESKFTLLLY